LRDLTGKRFGKLTAKKFSHRKGAHYYWQFKCDCGNQVVTRADDVGKAVFSCGCLHKEKVTTHRETKTRLHRIWIGMKNRCNNPKTKDHKNYGGRGIIVCEEWKNSYQNFRDWANANGYSDSLSIDRIDNDKGYSPNNCRWVSQKYQTNNRRSNHLITFNNVTKTVTQWEEFLGFPRNLVFNRLALGWSVERSLTTKPGSNATNIGGV
jgi:hypothetical protein